MEMRLCDDCCSFATPLDAAPCSVIAALDQARREGEGQRGQIAESPAIFRLFLGAGTIFRRRTNLEENLKIF